MVEQSISSKDYDFIADLWGDQQLPMKHINYFDETTSVAIYRAIIPFTNSAGVTATMEAEMTYDRADGAIQAWIQWGDMPRKWYSPPGIPLRHKSSVDKFIVQFRKFVNEYSRNV